MFNSYVKLPEGNVPIHSCDCWILDDLGILALDGLGYVGETTDTPNDNRHTEHIAWKKSESFQWAIIT